MQSGLLQTPRASPRQGWLALSPGLGWLQVPEANGGQQACQGGAGCGFSLCTLVTCRRAPMVACVHKGWTRALPFLSSVRVNFAVQQYAPGLCYSSLQLLRVSSSSVQQRMTAGI